MWPFRKKITVKEPKKIYPYGRHRGSSYEVSVWDNMSIIEKFAMVFLPCAMCCMFYVMLDITGWIWWLRLILSIGIVSIVISLIWLIVTWLTGYE